MRLGNQTGGDVRVKEVLACIGPFALPSVVTAQVPPPGKKRSALEASRVNGSPYAPPPDTARQHSPAGQDRLS